MFFISPNISPFSISVNSEYIFNNRFSSSDKLSIDKSSCFPVSKKYGDIPKNSQIGIISVSYTHLDVYKRQTVYSML